MTTALPATIFPPAYFINHQTGRKIHKELLNVKTLLLFQEGTELQIDGNWENARKGIPHAPPAFL